MGVLIGLKAFAAAVLGGIGSVTGAVLGGFIIGFTEVVAVALYPDLGGFKDAFAFIFLIFVFYISDSHTITNIFLFQRGQKDGRGGAGDGGLSVPAGTERRKWAVGSIRGFLSIFAV